MLNAPGEALRDARAALIAARRRGAACTAVPSVITAADECAVLTARITQLEQIQMLASSTKLHRV